MRTVLRKFFFIWDFDKEEAWLNEMAAQGLVLTAVGYCRYEFEDAPPGKYQIRLELLPNYPNHPESRRYLQFLEETGIRQVGSFQRWVYLCRSTEDGPFDLYSDRASRLKMLGRLMVLVGILAMPNLYNLGFNLYLYLQHDFSVNLFAGSCCLAVLFLLAWGWWRLYRKVRSIKREQDIFEE